MDLSAVLTLTMKFENGIPFSRENAHSIREAVAMMLLADKTFTAVMTAD